MSEWGIAQLVLRQVCHALKRQLENRGKCHHKGGLIQKKNLWNFPPKQHFRIVHFKTTCACKDEGVCLLKKLLTEGSGKNIISTRWNVTTGIFMSMHAQMALRLFSCKCVSEHFLKAKQEQNAPCTAKCPCVHHSYLQSNQKSPLKEGITTILPRV